LLLFLIIQVVASRLAKLEFCSLGSQAGAWEPAYLLALRGNAVKGALRRELSASYALHPDSAKDTKKIERRMFDIHLSNLDDGLYLLFLYPVFFRAFCAFRAFRGLRFFISYMRNIRY